MTTPVIFSLISAKRAEADGFEIFESDDAGKTSFVTAYDGEGALQLEYSPRTSSDGNRLLFLTADPDKIPLTHIYMRVTYMCDSPYPNVMKLVNCGDGKAFALTNATENSKGKFIRTNAVPIDVNILRRFREKKKTMLTVSPGYSETAVYLIREIAFFASEEDAYEYYGDAPVLDLPKDSQRSSVTIGGVAIEKFRIVTPRELPHYGDEGVNLLRNAVFEKTGAELEVVTDDTPETEYEILIGNTNRKESAAFYGIDNPFAKGDMEITAIKSVAVGTKYCIIYLFGDSLCQFASRFAYFGMTSGWTIDHAEGEEFCPDVLPIIPYEYGFDGVGDIPDPICEKIKFKASDVGIRPIEFSEYGEDNNWVLADEGRLAVVNKDKSVVSPLRLHLFERNVKVSASFKYSDADKGADLTFKLRDSIPEAYVDVTYRDGVWSVQVYMGMDFIKYTLASVNKPISENEWHSIDITLKNSHITTALDGETLLDVEGITYIAPGAIGFSAAHMKLSLCDITYTLLGGQGRLMEDVRYHTLPDDEYREGGSVIILKDGSWQYRHHSGASFNSKDNGKSWQRTEMWSKVAGYCNVFRLASGKLITVDFRDIGGARHWISKTSSDDGATWVGGGVICCSFYKGDELTRAGNMNDKFTQMSDGRIFYCQNYERFVPNRVFCEIYYSDDDGETWTKSETDSFEFEGNDDILFGECKIMQTSLGTLRVYCSWNASPDVVYSESTDNGKTWGRIHHIPELRCCRSSLQFCKDIYADNETTYYAVLVFDKLCKFSGFNRTRLALLKTPDGGITWEYLGDVLRREAEGHINHIVDPFINVTEDYIVCGTGVGEYYDRNKWHRAQRQRLFSMRKDTLTPYDEFPTTR